LQKTTTKVDKHIRRLDQDLKKFEAELEQAGATPEKKVESIKPPSQRKK
jgi:hypothetical protein